MSENTLYDPKNLDFGEIFSFIILKVCIMILVALNCDFYLCLFEYESVLKLDHIVGVCVDFV